jgi:demethylmenaquinone methyltransferase / 2-methoxy-6-polyprenyl-1,4-benzoquinol methylase
MPDLQHPSAVWDSNLLTNPHAVADKRRRVQQMFAAIAPSYDLNNRLHSLWMDQSWRKTAVKMAGLKAGDVVVDVACGTGDLTLQFAAGLTRLGGVTPGQIVGIDFTFEMLPLAAHKSVGQSIVWLNGDALSLPLPDASADVISIAFGIRNVSDPAAAMREFHRVLRPGGRLVILEFSLPTIVPLRAAYNLYFRHVLPRTATWISGDRTGAYKYLPESVNTFIDRARMSAMLGESGFANIAQRPLTFGICVCYVSTKG